jgi:hypothetical protein
VPGRSFALVYFYYNFEMILFQGDETGIKIAGPPTSPKASPDPSPKASSEEKETPQWTEMCLE